MEACEGDRWRRGERRWARDVGLQTKKGCDGQEKKKPCRNKGVRMPWVRVVLEMRLSVHDMAAELGWAGERRRLSPSSILACHVRAVRPAPSDWATMRLAVA